MSNSEFVKIAYELKATNTRDIVKVASILRRLQNIWKSIGNKDYRDAVTAVQQEAALTKVLAGQLGEALTELSSSLDDGDLKDYNKAMVNTRELLSEFLGELQRLDADSSQIWSYTVAEMYNPGFIEKVSEHLRAIGYDAELGEAYEDRKLRSFEWYEGAEADLHISEGARNQLVDKIIKAMPNSEGFLKTQQNLAEFLERFTNAVFEGNLISVSPRRPKKDEKARGGERELLIETSEFEIPSLGAVVQVQAIIIDKALEGETKGRKSLRGTKYVRVISPPTTSLEEQKELEAEPAEPEETKIEAIYKGTLVKEAGAVTRTVVKFTKEELADALVAGYQNVFGSPPSFETLSAGWAKVVHELGIVGGRINVPNNNFGNITSGGGGGEFYQVNAKEYDKSGKSFMVPGRKFVAWSSPEAGATAYWKFLNESGKGRYKPVLEAMKSGNPIDTAKALKDAGYYTAPVDVYAKGVSRHHNTFMTDLGDKYKEQLQSKPIAENITSQPKVPELDPNDEVDNLIMQLTATPLTNLVRRSYAPHNNVLIFVTSSVASEEDKIEYARATASVLSRHLDMKTSIHKSENDIEIQCFGLGTKNTLTKAIQAVCDMTSEAIFKSSDTKVYPIALADKVTKGEELDFDNLLKNRRRVNLRRVL